MRRVIWLLLLAMTACGGSQKLREASHARYRIPKDLLWREIGVVLRQRYPKVQVAAFDSNTLVTTWTETDIRHRAPPSPRARNAVFHEDQPVVLQFTVEVAGENPYQVHVDVEAALQSERAETASGLARIAWNPEHLATLPKDDLTLAIHERLKLYADPPPPAAR
jgi:hypothetical protein